MHIVHRQFTPQYSAGRHLTRSCMRQNASSRVQKRNLDSMPRLGGEVFFKHLRIPPGALRRKLQPGVQYSCRRGLVWSLDQLMTNVNPTQEGLRDLARPRRHEYRLLLRHFGISPGSATFCRDRYVPRSCSEVPRLAAKNR